jgi:hypothetical protein
MLRRAAVVVMLVSLLSVVAIPRASASTGVDVALALASLSLFTQFVGALSNSTSGSWGSSPWVHVVPGRTAGVLWSSPLIHVVAVPPPVVFSRVVEFPHGRYELRGEGTADKPFSWHWVPAPAIPTPPPPPPPAP